MTRLISFLLLCLLVSCDSGSAAPTATATSTPTLQQPALETQEDRNAEAKRLLAEAGYPDGQGLPTVELLYNTSENHKKIAEFIQEQWRVNIGANIELRNMEWKVYLDHLTRLDYQVARRGWVADYPDPNTFLDLFLTNSGNNNTGWSNAKYDGLIDTAARTLDPAERLTILQEAESILMTELPVIPLYFYVTQCMWRKNLNGFYDNPLNVHPLKEVAHDDGSKLLVMNVGAEPQTLDPNLERGVTEHRITISLFEGLTTYHPETLEPLPGVAESWTSSDEGRVWTFKLRDCTWTNGRPVTAGDFVYAWRRQIDPALASDYAYMNFNALKNGKASYDGGSADLTLKGFSDLAEDKQLEAARALPGLVQTRHVPMLKKLVSNSSGELKTLLEEALAIAPERKDVSVDDVGVRAIDDKTLEVTLENPTPYFLHLTSFFTYFPVPREVVEKHGDRWTFPEHIVTNGPFVLKEWVPNSHILVERNPKYWDAAKVRQKQIKMLPIDNTTTAYNMYQAKQCDWLDTVPLDNVEFLKGNPEFHTVPYLTTYYYSFNVKKPPFDNPKVRRALALAVDRSALVEAILQGGQKEAFSMVPPGLKGYASQTLLK